jgi:transcriptional regulator with XRE-family HTH domain
MTLLRLGALLRDRRGGRGIREVSKDIGISPATLTRIEAGRLPDLLTFRKISEWLKINPAELLGISVEDADHNGAYVEMQPQTAVHLKADQALPSGAAEDLAKLIMYAHQELARRIREGRVNVSTGI